LVIGCRLLVIGFQKFKIKKQGKTEGV
jgi:hypothetical protein